MPSQNSSETTACCEKQSQTLDLVLNKKVIGSGAFSEVRLAQNLRTEELLAAKITDLTKYRRYYDKEVKALTQIPPHPHIVPLVQYGEDGNTGYIFTEWVRGTPLGNYVNEKGNGQGIGEQESLEILLQLVNGIDAVHKANFAHNDLKPENIIYNPDTKTAHIIDFGLSTEVGPDGNVTECCGSPHYMSPEVITRSKKHNAFLSDIWSLGLIFYFMLVGNLPWSKTESFPELIKHMFNGKLTIPSTITNITRQLLSGMLQLAPKARWSLEKIRQFILQALELLKRKAKSVKIVTLYSLF